MQVSRPRKTGHELLNIHQRSTRNTLRGFLFSFASIAAGINNSRLEDPVSRFPRCSRSIILLHIAVQEEKGEDSKKQTEASRFAKFRFASMLLAFPRCVRVPLATDRWLNRDTTLSQTARFYSCIIWKLRGPCSLSLQRSRFLREKLEIS